MPRKNKLPDDPAEAERVCRLRAMDLLAQREHSRRELERKLAARGFTLKLIGPVLDGLVRDSLLEEGRFVESFIRSRARKGQGPVRIRGELAQHGIEEAAVSTALEQADFDWIEIAVEAREKRFGAQPPANFAERARQTRFLQHRGFEHGQIRAALAIEADSD